MLRKIILTASLAFAFIQFLYAQPEPPEPTPIDGGLISILLLGAGGALAAKKIKEKRNREG